MNDRVTACWQWQFPPCNKWIPSDFKSRSAQSVKVFEEANEVMNSIIGPDVHYVVELMDTIHACETALREFSDEQLNAAREMIIRKNAERGYYV